MHALILNFYLSTFYQLNYKIETWRVDNEKKENEHENRRNRINEEYGG